MSDGRTSMTARSAGPITNHESPITPFGLLSSFSAMPVTPRARAAPASQSSSPGGLFVRESACVDVGDAVALGVGAADARGVGEVDPEAVGRGQAGALADHDDDEPGGEPLADLVAERDAALQRNDDRPRRTSRRRESGRARRAAARRGVCTAIAERPSSMATAISAGRPSSRRALSSSRRRPRSGRVR